MFSLEAGSAASRFGLPQVATPEGGIDLLQSPVNRELQLFRPSETATQSIWGREGEFFYGFLSDIVREGLPKDICFLGCGDGKYVIPAARNGFKCLAIDIDTLSLYGGVDEKIQLPDKSVTGLVQRMKAEQVEEFVEVRNVSFLTDEASSKHAAVFVTAAIHYEDNAQYPLSYILSRINRYVQVGGLLYHEYIHRSQYDNDPDKKFVTFDELEEFYKNGWEILKHEVVEVVDDPNPRDGSAHEVLWGTFYAKRVCEE
jgi:hypothetical protein